jgi:hypothetical protein
LADVPGVGSHIAERYGRLILGALERAPVAPERDPAGDPVALALEQWRATVAREMGVPAYVVLGDRALAALAAPPGESDPRAVPAGPRFRAKFEAEVERVLGRVRGVK